MIQKIKKELRKSGRKEKAEVLSRFFKTGKGQYGEGDKFLGVMVPETRRIAKKYLRVSFSDIKKLLVSEWHEERLVALLILVERFNLGNESDKKIIYNFYMNNAKKVNNWDLVDLSAHKIVGAYLFDKNKSILYKLAKSNNLWERRISIIATFYFLNNRRYSDTFKISEILLKDDHDLIHKAVGWMLREVGKRNQAEEEKFLKKHYKNMPRTMLRYAIERFDDKKRKFYMNNS